jgi:SecD/SecF fusion protein
MHKHTYRTVLIWAVFILSVILVYPTIGWMMLSDGQRQARLEKWEQEDLEYHKPSTWRDLKESVVRWVQFDRDRVINLGLDLQGGIQMVLRLNVDAMDAKTRQEYKDRGYSEAQMIQELQQMALQTIRRRVAEFEAKEPTITTLGNDQIQVQLPGEKDIKRARNLIMKTAYLTFHIVAGGDETSAAFAKIDKHFNNNFVPLLVRPFGTSNSMRVPVDSIEKVRIMVEEANENPELVPADKIVAFGGPPNPWDEPYHEIYLMDRDPAATGEGLRLAYARPNQESLEGHWEVNFQFDGAGARRFADVTEEHKGRDMAIVLDGVVVSAPRIQERIYGSGRITGSFSPEQAQDLKIALNSGAMPVPVVEEYTGVISASLGQDSIRKGTMSGIIGLIIVLIFMAVYYRFGGIVANIALFLNAVFILAALAYFNATLTLPGIAGLILTIGMAVDANVLIYERIREELRNGRSLLAAIDRGYDRATITILDANVTTLIAAAVLWQFGTGPIEGFAVALAIGVCASVFTALIVTRAIFDSLAERKMLRKMTMMSFFKPDSSFNFIGWRKYAYMLSAVLILGGLAVTGVRGKGMMGVDFTTGTNMVVTLLADTTIPNGDVRRVLEDVGFKSAVVQRYEGEDLAGANTFLIRISAEPGETAAEEGETVAGQVEAAMAKLVESPSKIELGQVQTVGAAVGRRLTMDAIAAITYALFFIIAYLWFRFELKFSIGAVAALVHDVLFTVGLFAVTGREITLPVVAAILTIIGYSLNDTIVVFDRIREDLRIYRGRGYSYAEVMNMSINQTLSRTILTSLTTLFVVVVLYLFGGVAINDFAFALMVGVVVGTYSSIFVASPIVLLLERLRPRHALQSTREQDKAKGGRKRPDSKKKAKTSASEGEATV